MCLEIYSIIVLTIRIWHANNNDDGSVQVVKKWIIIYLWLFRFNYFFSIIERGIFPHARV